jgi:Rha family phage regulatory protein
MAEKTKKNSSVQKIVEIVVHEDKPMVSSLVVAEHFGKRHDTILRKIKELDVPETFSHRNFAVANYLDEQGKPRVLYNMTRDGFTLIAMGLTGKEATQWKILYIEAFNAMEDRLNAGVPMVETKYLIVPANPEELTSFKGLMRYWCYLEDITWEEGKSQMETMLRVPNLDQIDALTLHMAWIVLDLNMVVVPTTKSGPYCTDEDLAPVTGLLDYWEYASLTDQGELANRICKRMMISDLSQLPKSCVPHAVSLIWDNINQEGGKSYALKESRN